MAQPPAHPYPHPGWYAAPAAALAVSVVSVATALKVWALDRIAWTLNNANASNASNGDWQAGWDHHDSTIRMYLALALIACGLAIGGLTAIVGARGRTNT